MSLNPEEREYCRFAYKMVREQKRLQTFEKWIFPDDANCSAAKLAEAGFFFCGSKEEPDAVQCFLCKKSLDGWEESDDPWKEHINHAAYCDFAKTRKPEKQLTLLEIMAFSESVLHSAIDKVFADRKEVVLSDFKQVQKAIADLIKK